MDYLLVLLLESAFHFILNQNYFSKRMAREVDKWIYAGPNFISGATGKVL